MMDNEKNFDEMMAKIVRGLEEAYRRMVEFKKQKNSPIIVSRDGKIVELDPYEAPATTIYKWEPSPSSSSD